MSEDDTMNPDEAKLNSAPLPSPSVIRVFLDQTRDAFKTSIQHLAEYGVTIRSFTELRDHMVDVESGLPITQQLIIQAYRHAVLVSTVEALFKQTDTAAPSGSNACAGSEDRVEHRSDRESASTARRTVGKTQS